MELPLFPLNTVLCPGIALPLHIFEERYRALVRHCLETTSPFGVVLIREGREVGAGAISFTAIGTIAEIRDAGRYDDGRYDLLVVGTRRFEIRRVLERTAPYLVAEVDVLDETVGDADERPPPGDAGHPPVRRPTSSCSSRARARRPTRSTSGSRSRPRTTTMMPRTRSPEAERRRVDRGRGRRPMPADGPTRPAPGRDPRRPDRRCRTCSPASSRSSCRAARRCSSRDDRGAAARPARADRPRDLLLLKRRLRAFIPDAGSTLGKRRQLTTAKVALA